MEAPSIDGPIPARAGIGLRFAHHQAFIDGCPPAPWLEVHAENYMGGGPTPAMLDAIRARYPLSLHGVGLSLGSAQGLASKHLERMRRAIDRFRPALVSEHLSWNVVDERYLADLLPLPMTEEALDVVCRNVDHAQDALQCRLLVENPSTYLQFAHSTVPEWEFLAAVSARTGCGILCDVNNIHVSAANHGWSALGYLDALPADAVGEIHLAGHSVRQLDQGRTIRIDDHGSAVSPEVWALYGHAVRRFGRVPTLIEWDNNLPTLAVLLEQAALAQEILDSFDHHAERALAS
jgi:uncharacterized protein (UPF0276 family)